MSGRPLVIGVGNPDRGDDGVGQVVVDRAEGHPGLAGAEVRRAMQLTPELAADVAEASVVVIVDARVGVPAGDVAWALVERRSLASGPGPLSHHLDPSGLCHLAGFAFGRVPPVYVIGVGAATFDPGAPLSGPARAAVPHAVDRVIGLVTSGAGDPWSPSRGRRRPGRR